MLRSAAASRASRSTRALAPAFRAIFRDARFAGSSESDSILPALALRFEAPCETSGEESDAGDQEPSFGAGDGCLVVLGEAAVASEPSVSAFDDPAFALRLECSDLL